MTLTMGEKMYHPFQFIGRKKRKVMKRKHSLLNALHSRQRALPFFPNKGDFPPGASPPRTLHFLPATLSSSLSMKLILILCSSHPDRFVFLYFCRSR